MMLSLSWERQGCTKDVDEMKIFNRVQANENLLQSIRLKILRFIHLKT